MTHYKVILQLLSAKVEVSVLKTKLLVCLCIVNYLKRRCLSHRKYTKVGNENFNVACLYIVILALSFTQKSLCHKHIFALYLLCLFKYGRLCCIVEYKLNNACAVTQVNEHKAALISYSLYKSGNGNGTADTLDLAAIMCALKTFHCV